MIINSKPIYELPEGVQIEDYREYYGRDVSFIPDICINKWGKVGIQPYKQSNGQVCIKSTDKKLLDYLKRFDWSANKMSIGANSCNMSDVKKIISDYYKGVENDNK